MSTPQQYPERKLLTEAKPTRQFERYKCSLSIFIKRAIRPSAPNSMSLRIENSFGDSGGRHAFIRRHRI